MKLLTIPLIFLIILGLMSMMGLGTVEYQSDTVLFHGTEGWFDANGKQVAYENYTRADPADDGRVWWVGGVPIWHNSTGDYQMWTASDQTNESGIETITVDVGSSLGFIGLVFGVMALATIAGLQVLGSGISDESVSAIVKGSALITLWGFFSAMSLALILTIPYSLGAIFYFFLTGIYTLGIINQIGHPGSD